MALEFTAGLAVVVVAVLVVRLLARRSVAPPVTLLLILIENDGAGEPRGPGGDLDRKAMMLSLVSWLVRFLTRKGGSIVVWVLIYGGNNAFVRVLRSSDEDAITGERLRVAGGSLRGCFTAAIYTSLYYIRTFTVYDNFDGKSHSSSFHLSVEGNLVFSWRSPWQKDVSRSGAYSDLIAFVSDGEADICFYNIATDYPEKTLCFFPISFGKKNCYVIPGLPLGRYYIRTFTVYDNFDGKSHSPSFHLSVEGNLVFSWRSPWQKDVSRSGA
ncbi:hypothetical protein RJ640_029351 [Escallonia rubra]|uniref:Malectin-like domain-containing protein n=1 Tax=Escallonia rubra TaxID=112253 RepID=A0AA88UQK1_9ASTE|nr:hypothetical protein RJ640_029351 [Escallonia rubra]